MRGRLQNQPLEAARDYGLGCVRNAELGPIRYAYSMLIFALLYVIFLKMGGRLTPHFSAFWVYKNSPPPKKKVKILRFIVTTYPATVVLALKAEHAITVKQTCTQYSRECMELPSYQRSTSLAFLMNSCETPYGIPWDNPMKSKPAPRDPNLFRGYPGVPWVLPCGGFRWEIMESRWNMMEVSVGMPFVGCSPIAIPTLPRPTSGARFKPPSRSLCVCTR